MTPQEILSSIKYRLDNLQKAEKVFMTQPIAMGAMIDETRAKIDELETLYQYIYENVSELQQSQKGQLTKKKRVKRSK